MPIYEYKCSSCQKIFEVFQRITEDPLASCPDCHGSVKKLVSMSAFHLKGGGWYADGYSSGRGNGGNSSGKGTPAAAGADNTTGAKKTPDTTQSDGKSAGPQKNNQVSASQ